MFNIVVDVIGNKNGIQIQKEKVCEENLMASTKKLLNLISEFGKHAIQEQYAKIIYIPIYQ